MSEPSPELRAARDLLASIELFGPDVTVADQRAMWEAAAAAAPPGDDVTVSVDVVGGVRAEWVSTPSSRPERVLVYLHGGGYVIGGPPTHRDVVSRLAAASETTALVVDYRLAPEYPFPAALDDAVAAYRAVLAAGFDHRQVAVAGDSAGGGLALATLLSARDAGDPLPAAVVCCSPWVDLALSGDSIDGRAAEDPILSRRWLEQMARSYAADTDRTTPLVSPLYADLRGMPPMLIVVGTAEILHDDATRLFERAVEAGVDTEFESYPGCIHLWMQVARDAPEAAQGVAHIGAYLRSRLGGPPEGRSASGPQSGQP